MVRNRLQVHVESLVRRLCLLFMTGLLLSAASAPHRWAWDYDADLVPVDIAQGPDDALSPADDNLAAVVDVTTRGVVGDGVKSNTAAIQAVIEGLGPAGGTVRFPAGRYVTGTVRLHDNVTLRLDAGATLVGSLDPGEYRVVHRCGLAGCLVHGTGLVVANHARHVRIVGRGTVDGQGAALLARGTAGPRPFLCRWVGCDDVVVSGVTFVDPANWVQHFHKCRQIRLDRVTVRCVDSPNGNTDGIDIDSCQGVRVTRCDINSGDDAIVLKTTSASPCRDVEVENCRLSTHCNGVKFGTESAGGFEHVRVRRCSMTDVGQAGIAICSVDGGDVRDVSITDVQMRAVRTPILIRLGARLATFHGDRRPSVGSIDGVTIRGVRASGSERTGVLVSGLPGHPIRSLTLDDVRIGTAGGIAAEDAPMSVKELPKDYPQDDMFGRVVPASGLYLRHVRGLTLGNSVTTDTEQPDPRPARVQIDVQS